MKYILLAILLSVILSSRVSFGQFIVAHRGASSDTPENTLSAFRLAWEQQADAIEADFYLTKDQKIVCIHDKSTKRTAPHQPDIVVADSTLQQLRTYDVGSWKAPQFKDERIPTLDEVLLTVPTGKQIFVEIKCGPEILPFLKSALEESRLDADQIVIICFDDEVVRAARESMPQYKSNWLTGYKQNEAKTKWAPSLPQILDSLHRTMATGLGTNGKREVVDAAFVKEVVDAGYEFHVWTINEPDDAIYFASLAARSITTDNPRRIREVLDSLKNRDK